MGLSRRRFAAGLTLGLALPAAVRVAAEARAEILAALAELPQLHAVLVQRGDEVVVAHSPNGAGLDRAANIKSCSKSIVALLLGAAVTRGEVPGVEARLGDVAPALIPADADPRVADITLEDLVTLRAGLESTSGQKYGAWVGSRNWVSHALSRPMIAEPGGPMVYSTGTTHVLGAALAATSGRSLLSLARERIGAPLGVEVPAWTRDPQGFYLGGNEMAITPRAMLRIAVMMRDAGRHDGREVLPADWIRASTIPRTRSPYSGLRYGYGWFLSESGYILARGYGGQLIVAHPRRGLAVAITSDPNQPARSEGYFGALMRLLDGPILTLG